MQGGVYLRYTTSNVKHKNKKMLPILACGLAYVLWGLNTPVIKISVDAIPVFQLLLIKFLLGSIVFGALAARNWRPIPKSIRWRIIAATISGYVLTTALLYKGIQLTGGLNASLLYLLAPLVLFFFSIKFLKERFDSKLLVGVIAGLLGAVLIIGGPLLTGSEGADGNILGNALIIGAILADVVGTILIKPTLKRLSAVQMTAIRFWIATIVLIPFSVSGLPALADVTIDTRTFIALVYSLVFATLIAFYIYQWGFRRISGEQVSTLHYLDPMVGAVGSIVLLGDQVTTLMIVGVGLVLAGLYFSEVHKLKIIHHISHHR